MIHALGLRRGFTVVMVAASKYIPPLRQASPREAQQRAEERQTPEYPDLSQHRKGSSITESADCNLVRTS